MATRVRPRSGTERGPLLAFVGGLALTCALYWSNLSGGYLSDDFWLMDGLRRSGPSAYWLFGDPFFRPQSAFELWAIDHVFPAHPWVLRAVNLAMFLASVLLVRLLTLRLMASEDRPQIAAWTATFAALLYAFYPSHSEPVNWICCLGDTTGAVEALIPFLLIFSYFRAEGVKKGLFLGLIGLFTALSLTSKEIFLLYPPLLLGLGFLILRDQPLKQKVRQLWPLAVMDGGILAFYYFVHNLLGNHWGYLDQHTTPRAVELRNLTFELPNVFLPIVKWFDGGGEAVILWPLAIVAIAFALGAVLRIPQSGKEAKGRFREIREWCAQRRALLFFVWAAALFFFAELWEGDPIVEACFALGLGTVLFLTRRADWNKLFWPVACFFVASCFLLMSREDLLLYDLFNLSGWSAVFRGKFSVAMLLCFAYVNRGSLRSWSSDERHWLAVVVLFVAAGAFMLLPSMGVWTGSVQADGRGQRLAYESTFFVAIAFAMVLALFLANKPKLFAGVGLSLLAAYAAGLYVNNQDWSEAGRISSRVANQLAPLVKGNPRRIYMLSTIFYSGSAELYHNGDDKIVSAYFPNSAVQCRAAMVEQNHLPGDRVLLRKADLKDLVFRMELKLAPSRTARFVGAGYEPAGSGTIAPWFKYFKKTGELRLVGFKPGDRIVYIDGDQLRVIL